MFSQEQRAAWLVLRVRRSNAASYGTTRCKVPLSSSFLCWNEFSNPSLRRAGTRYRS